jgi:hypothetical protein
MGRYLTDEQLALIQDELSLLYSLPYAIDLVGTAWEQVLARAKGGVWTGKRDNRARPDVTTGEGEEQVRYSVKTEALRVTRDRARAADFLGRKEDLIVARPKVDELLGDPRTLSGMPADELGSLVLRFYNDRIVRHYKWDVISILLRVGNTEFIYWEERPVPLYDPPAYWWRDSDRATGGNRNINGYPLSVARDTDLGALPRARFKWTSGGKQFYVLYDIPKDADLLVISPLQLTREEIRQALQTKLVEKLRAAGVAVPT